MSFSPPLLDMAERAAARSRPLGGRLSVLVLSAAPTAGRVVRRALHPVRRVVVAREARRGLKLALRLRPDVLLVDDPMPGAGPDGLLRALRREPRLRDLPVLLLSHAAWMRGLGRRGRKAGWSLAAQLERHVDERTAELRQLAAEMEAAESRERSEIARELHDDLGQMLAAVNIRLALLGRHPREDVRQTADELSALVDRAQRCARSLAARLSPAVLNQLGLVPALEWLADEFRASHGLQVVVDDDGVPKPLSQTARSIVYRAVQALLLNVGQHAGVRGARVQLRTRGGTMCVRISDEGAGGASSPGGSVGPRQAGLGLRAVRERLSYIGGRFTLRSVPGDGTEAVLTVPLESPEGLEAGRRGGGRRGRRP